VLRFLKRITYKPGYKFSCWLDSENSTSMVDQRLVLNMVVPVPDSTRADHKPTSLVFTSTFPLIEVVHGGPDLLLHRVKDFFLTWERHELDEWFRLDGKMLHDPHAKERHNGYGNDRR